MKASWLTYRESDDERVPDGACGSQHDHHACDDEHGESYAPGDASAHDAADA